MTIDYIYQLAKLGDFMNCKSILKMNFVSCAYTLRDVTDMVNHDLNILRAEHNFCSK